MTAGYEGLMRALDAALQQASEGKGKERHSEMLGNFYAFEHQPIMQVTRMVGTGFPAGQAMKKVHEAVEMSRGRGGKTLEHAQDEVLGAIVYLAALWLYLEEDSR